MKTQVVSMLALSIMASANAQNCFEFSITNSLAIAENVELGTSAEMYSHCTLVKGPVDDDSCQYKIASYGADLDRMKSFVAQKDSDFTNASVDATLSNGSTQNAMALAQQLQGMSQEQQRAYVMSHLSSIAGSTGTTPTIQDGSNVINIVAQTKSLVDQLNVLTGNVLTELRNTRIARENAVQAVKLPAPCEDNPNDPGVHLPPCSCVFAKNDAYNGERVSITDKYNAQLVAVLQNYIPQIKAVTTQIDYNISKLHNGQDIKSPVFKKSLFSYQVSAFNSAFLIMGLIEDVRESGTDVYRQKVVGHSKHCASCE